LKARRRVATVAAMALGTVLLAGPAHADTPAINCRKAGNDVKGSSVPTSVGHPKGGLLGLTNSLNEVLTAIDQVNIENVRLIENVYILSTVDAVSAPCR
jgi:hypothetical protein